MSRILKYFVPEFSGLTYDEIQKCFMENEDADSCINVVLANSESKPVGEKEVDFDLKFKVKDPLISLSFIYMHIGHSYEGADEAF